MWNWIDRVQKSICIENRKYWIRTFLHIKNMGNWKAKLIHFSTEEKNRQKSKVIKVKKIILMETGKKSWKQKWQKLSNWIYFPVPIWQNFLPTLAGKITYEVTDNTVGWGSKGRVTTDSRYERPLSKTNLDKIFFFLANPRMSEWTESTGFSVTNKNCTKAREIPWKDQQ